MAQPVHTKSGPDITLADPIGGTTDEIILSDSFNQQGQLAYSSNVRPIFKSSKESQKYGNRGGSLIDSPLEVHVGGSTNLQTRKDGNAGGSTGTKTSPSSAGNGSGQESRAPTALAGWSPTSMTTTASISVGHSPGLMDTSQGSASKGATDTPSPQYQGDITISSTSHPETPSPPRRLKKSVITSTQHEINGASFKPRASLYNNVFPNVHLKEDENVESIVVMRRKQYPKGRGRGGRDGNNLLRSALETHFQDPSNKELDDYVR